MTHQRMTRLPLCILALTTAASAEFVRADYAVQDNIAFNAKKINPYNGGPAWQFEDTFTLFDERLAPGGPVTIGPLDADPLGVAVEALLGVDLPHLVKLKAGASLSGHAQANLGYYVTGGRLDISYPASASLNFETAPGTTNVVQANQSYAVDGGFLPGVSQRFVPSQFLQTSGGAGYATAPLRSQTDYQQPWFETQSPNASAWVEASADIQASIFTKVSALGGLKEWRKDIRAGGKVGGRLVEVDPTGLYVAGSAEPVVGFNIFEPIGPIPIGAGAADLTFQVPNIAVSSVTNPLPAQGGVITARKEQPLVKLTGNLERLIPFVGTILQNEIGPLGYDLLNVAGGPELKLYQEMTFTPDPKVRLNFSEPVLAGASNIPTIEAVFDLDDAISWKPMFSNSSSITVTPTYLLNNTFRNKTGLKVDLVVDVEALSLKGEFPPFNGTLGPLYEKQLTVPIIPDIELLAPEFNIPLGSVTAGSIPGIGPITTGAITFQKSNLDVAPGLGDLELVTWAQGQPDPLNPGYYVTDLEFARAVAGGTPRRYQASAVLRASDIMPEGGGEGDEASFFESLTNVDIIAADVDSNEQVNLGRYIGYSGFDLSEFLPTSSPAYPDPILGELYVSTQPDDLSNVPGVDINPVGHPTLGQYNATDDFRTPDERIYDTAVIDRRLGPTTTIVARSGDPVPDGFAQLMAQYFPPSINASGRIAFSSSLDSNRESEIGDHGFYVADADALRKALREGDPLPFGGGVVEALSESDVSGFNDAGQTVLSHTVYVLRSEAGGALTEIVRAGQATPDGTGQLLSMYAGGFNASGDVLFKGDYYDPLQNKILSGVYLGDGATLTKIVQQGDAVPGFVAPLDNFGQYSLNDSGQVAFDAFTFQGQSGVFRHDGNVVTQVAVSGAPAPNGGTLNFLGDADINNSGDVAFQAHVVRPGLGPAQGVFKWNGAQVSEVVLNAGNQFGDTIIGLALNDQGDVAFGSTNGVYLYTGGSLQTIVMRDLVTPDGTSFFKEYDKWRLNEQGHIAFSTSVQESGVAQLHNGIYVHDGTNLVEIARTGRALGGSLITALELGDINDQMQVAYRAELADGRFVIARFEPSNYWAGAGNGNWEASSSWSLGVIPTDPCDVFIIAENPLTLAGPQENRTVKSLTLGGDNSATATLSLASGSTLTAVNGTTIRPNGVLTGNGTLVGPVVNDGTVSPGNSPGTLQIDGDYTQTASGTLRIELASAASRDRIFVDGDITLDGTLTISLLNGFVPALGQSFPLFEGSLGSISGAFDAVNAPLVNGVTLNVVQVGGSIMLQAAPFVAGDFNHDGTVDGADLANWESGYGVASGSATHTQGDADGDANVDGADFLTWQRQLGFTTPFVPAQTSVPEPTTALLSLAAIVLPWRRRGRRAGPGAMCR